MVDTVTKQQLGNASGVLVYWQFLACFEGHLAGLKSNITTVEQSKYQCEEHLSDDNVKNVRQCEQGEAGTDLELTAAKATVHALSKSHARAPLILVDGQPTAANKVVDEVCKRAGKACRRRLL